MGNTIHNIMSLSSRKLDEDELKQFIDNLKPPELRALGDFESKASYNTVDCHWTTKREPSVEYVVHLIYENPDIFVDYSYNDYLGGCRGTIIGNSSWRNRVIQTHYRLSCDFEPPKSEESILERIRIEQEEERSMLEQMREESILEQLRVEQEREESMLEQMKEEQREP